MKLESTDKQAFVKLMAGIGEYYNRQMSPMLVDIYWQGLQGYDFASVSAAINAHARNPDSGQYIPKIADVERHIKGNSGTRAMQAWVKVANAIQEIGTYETVAFSDPLIHACIDDMGGWVQFGMITDDELPFKIKEFEKRYMAYLQIPPVRKPPAALIGVYDARNIVQGHAKRDVVMIGDDGATKLMLEDKE